MAHGEIYEPEQGMLEAAGVCSLGVVTPKVGEAFVVHRLVLRRSKGSVGGLGSALAGKAPLHRVSAAPRQTVSCAFVSMLQC